MINKHSMHVWRKKACEETSTIPTLTALEKARYEHITSDHNYLRLSTLPTCIHWCNYCHYYGIQHHSPNNHKRATRVQPVIHFKVWDHEPILLSITERSWLRVTIFLLRLGCAWGLQQKKQNRFSSLCLLFCLTLHDLVSFFIFLQILFSFICVIAICGHVVPWDWWPFSDYCCV